jgi:hypothetical protein
MSIVRLTALCAAAIFVVIAAAAGAEIAEKQKPYLKNKRYAKAPKPPKQLANTDKEPDLKKGFVEMFNGKDLAGWSVKGGSSKYHWENGQVVGVNDPKSKGNSFLVTDRKDYADFIFTCEFKWDVVGNSGIQFRSFLKGSRVCGYQFEMDPSSRGWTGGIYGEAFGSWKYCLWLKAHDAARKSLKMKDWNRVTIQAKGKELKTWLNGVGCANLINDELKKGLFGLQIHKGRTGQIRWRNVRIKEFK